MCSIFLTLGSNFVLAAGSDKTVVCDGEIKGTFTLADKKDEYDMDYWEYTSEQLVLAISVNTDMSDYSGPDYVQETSGMPRIKIMDVLLSKVQGNDLISASASSNAIDKKLKVDIIYRAKKDGTQIYQHCKEI